MSSSHTTLQRRSPLSAVNGPCLAKTNLVGYSLQALHQGWQVPFCLAWERRQRNLLRGPSPEVAVQLQGDS